MDLNSSRKKTESIRTESKRLEKSYRNKDEKGSAESYFKLGNIYFEKGDYVQSEKYFIQSKNIFTQIKNKEGVAKVSRQLAKVQEAQNKLKEAMGNYKIASQNAEMPEEETVNENDVSRLASQDGVTQQQLINQNIQLNTQQGKKDEVALGYSQLADLNLKEKKIPEAIENYENAYEVSKTENPEKARDYNQSLTNVYVENQQLDKAIEVKKKVLGESFVAKDSKAKIEESQSLADLYIKKNDPNQAQKILHEAYQISVERGHTLEAKRMVEKLDSLFSLHNDSHSSLSLYRDFLTHLPTTIARDSTLLDNQLTEEIEARITQLEKEKQLQEDVLRRKNLFNYSLLASVGVLGLLIGLILFTMYKLRIRNKKIALQSLRREMNPHFIFNSLNSVNHFISSNDEIEANRYLTRFSKLMRSVMENSKDDFIPLNQELDLIKNYLELEKSRFPDKFDYQIQVNDSVNTTAMIPVMLLQPFIENAIWHGLRYREEKGWVHIKINQEKNQLLIEIEDNGIGIAQSKTQKTEHQKQRKGRGMQNTRERIKILNNLYNKKIQCKIADKPVPDNGVLVSIKFDL